MIFGRVTINLPKELCEQVAQIKKRSFYDKSLSELLRHLIKLGVSIENKKDAERHIWFCVVQIK